jgi:hypothetical protein
MLVKGSVIQGDQVWFGHLGIVVFTDWIFFYGMTAPSGPGPPHYRRSTLGRTPLDEWSARRRDLYLTKHNAHKRQTYKPPAGFEPAIPTSEWSQSLALDCAATGNGTIGGDSNMNKSGGYKHIYMLPFDWLDRCLFFSWKKKDMISKPSSDHGRQLTSPTGLRATYLSGGRKTIWFWRLRVAVIENWHLLWNLKHIHRRLSLV